MKMKKKIAIDIDDVLIPFAEHAVAYVTSRSGKPVSMLELYTENGNGVSASGLTDEEFVRLVREYQESDFPMRRRPLLGAREALKKLSKEFEIHIITSRDPKHEPHTRKWLCEYIDDILSDYTLSFVGNPFSGTEHSTKAAICHEIGAMWLIDDQTKYADQLKVGSTRAILFGDYDWNKDHKGDHFVRAKDWNDVLKHVL